MNANPLDIIKKSGSDLFENISKTREMTLEDGALSKKNKLLIALALDAANGAVNGVKSLASQAMQNGATKEEIMEAVRVANYVSGAGSVYTAANALKDIF
jgi:AhpD family alkylhydroperoxidase